MSPGDGSAHVHVVEQGETLSRIAAENGFADLHTILDHPKNAELKARRKNPDVLAPGDEVFIPAFVPRVEKVATGDRHAFVLTLPLAFLRLRLRDLDSRLLAPEEDCLVATGDGDDAEPRHADADGVVEKEISPLLETAELRVATRNVKMDVLVGELDPVETLSGQRARLNNLGYFAGFTEKDRKHFRWAAEEFNKDKGVSPMAVKEEDIDPVEGLKAPAFRKKLLKESGS